MKFRVEYEVRHPKMGTQLDSVVHHCFVDIEEQDVYACLTYFKDIMSWMGIELYTVKSVLHPDDWKAIVLKHIKE